MEETQFLLPWYLSGPRTPDTIFSSRQCKIIQMAFLELCDLCILNLFTCWNSEDSPDEASWSTDFSPATWLRFHNNSGLHSALWMTSEWFQIWCQPTKAWEFTLYWVLRALIYKQTPARWAQIKRCVSQSPSHSKSWSTGCSLIRNLTTHVMV